MIRSMTGYGRAKEANLTLEIKAVNHRYLDISVRAPRLCAFLEEPVKSLVQQEIGRGKVEVQIQIERDSKEKADIALNDAVLLGYITAASAISEKYGLTNNLKVSDILRLPEVMMVEKAEPDTEALVQLAEELTRRALEDFQAMRVREGVRLAKDMLERCDAVEKLTMQAQERSAVAVLEYRQRLEKKLREILENHTIDESRILTEAAIFADKVAIDEETTRLHSHIDQLRFMLKSGGVIGRKLDFLVQEFGREANTIGSKANDSELARIVVEMKAEIEKIREQLQNLE